MKDGFNVAIAGATGAVGVEILKLLEQRNFPVKELKLLASEHSAGKAVTFKGKKFTIEVLRQDSFKGIDFAFFSAGATRSREFVPAAVEAGATVLDNSSAFRMDPKVPLVIPEVNRDDLKNHQGVISVPNCSAIVMCVALWPLHQAAKIKRIVVSTYQAASGAGAKAMQELEQQTRDIVEGKIPKKEVFPHQIAFNLFSHNTKIAANGFNEEENKIVEETRKMFHEPQLAILPTCIRVPVLRAHSESIMIETERDLPEDEARSILSKAPGVKVIDDREANHFPMPLEASGQLDVLVGRIRKDLHTPNSLAMFVSGDQLLKGAAWDAVQITEELIKSDWVRGQNRGCGCGAKEACC
jgi:aspartate-semialdehyde dehydrogenase